MELSTKLVTLPGVDYLKITNMVDQMILLSESLILPFYQHEMIDIYIDELIARQFGGEIVHDFYKDNCANWEKRYEYIDQLNMFYVSDVIKSEEKSKEQVLRIIGSLLHSINVEKLEDEEQKNILKSVQDF